MYIDIYIYKQNTNVIQFIYLKFYNPKKIEIKQILVTEILGPKRSGAASEKQPEQLQFMMSNVGMLRAEN